MTATATLLLVALGVGTVLAQEPAGGLQTRAEATNFVETSRYADVLAFLAGVDSLDPAIHRTTFGYSVEGRALPLVVWGAPAAEAQSVRATGKTRVLVMANIHAGEVEGKEAVLELLREIARGGHAGWTDSLVVLFAPIYNADGNERVALDNRPLQLGPVGGMGQRPNARGLDLNRDYMKLESPEARSLVALFTDYDPHVVIDLHTTDGTFHAYQLTYSPPLAPDTDPAIADWLRQTWLPAVSRAMRPDWLTFDYGNLPEDEGEERPRGWYTFSPQPRFGNNYEGLRNRFGILSEAYSYLPFEERIAVTKRFVSELLDFARDHATEIRRRTEEADARRVIGEKMATRSDFAPPGEPVEILLGAVDTVPHPYTGLPMLRRRDVVRSERMPAYLAFHAIDTEVVPAAYLVPPDLAPALDRLRAHGIRTRRLETSRALDVEAFAIDSTRQAADEFQGHRERTIAGRWETARREIPAGWIVVPMDQPLARVAFHLLEPRSADGLVDWNLLDMALEGAAEYPILRTAAPLD